jgi:D-arabinose 1-dehydrogenase-like Zn-dependent alcohol dehydrogenase
MEDLFLAAMAVGAILFVIHAIKNVGCAGGQAIGIVGLGAAALYLLGFLPL